MTKARSFQPTIAVDTREQNPLQFTNLPTTRSTLTTGDYSVLGLVDLIAAERKSLTDLLGCFGHGRDRFKSELQRMAAMPFRLLIVETDADALHAGVWRHSSQSPAVVLGSLASWSAYYGLPIWLGGSPEQCAEFLERWLYQAARHVCDRYAAAAEFCAVAEAKGVDDGGDL